MQALNRVLEHARLHQAPRFAASMVRRAEGFNNWYASRQAADVKKGIARLRQRLTRPNQDLQALLTTFWPDMEFNGLDQEV